MNAAKVIKYINYICYIVTLIGYFLFYKFRGSNFPNAKLSLHIYLLVLLIVSIIPIFFKTLPKNERIKQIIFFSFLLVGFLITLYL